MPNLRSRPANDTARRLGTGYIILRGGPPVREVPESGPNAVSWSLILFILFAGSFGLAHSIFLIVGASK